MPLVYQWDSAILLTLLAVPVIITVAVVAARQWRDRVAQPLWWLSLVLLVWVIAHAFEFAAADRATVWWWLRIGFIGIMAVGPLWLLITLRYFGIDRRLGRALLPLLLLPPVLSYGALLTNEQHHLFYTALDVGLYRRGPLFWLHAVTAYGYILIALGITIASAVRASPAQRRRLALLVAAALIPIIGNAVHLSLGRPGTLDPTPVLLAVSLALLAYALIRGRLLQARPVALRTALAAVPDAILVANTSGQIIEMNPAAIHLLHAVADGQLGDALAFVGASPDDRDRLLYAAPQTLLLRDSHRVLETRSAPVFEDGQPGGLIVILRDVSEREQLIDQLAAAHAELEVRVAARTAELAAARAEADARAAELTTALAAIPNGIVVTDTDGCPRLVNKAAEELLDGPIDTTQTLDRHLLRLNPRDAAGHALTADADLFGGVLTGQPPASTEVIVHPDTPRARDLVIATAPILGTGRAVTGLVAVFHDVSELRRLERARREFLAMVAHELRSPIATISMGAQLLQRLIGQEQLASDELIRREREPVAAILRQAQRLSTLISDLLEGARLEVNSLTLQPAAFDLAELVRRLAQEAATTIAGYPIVTELPGPVWVMADPARVEQIILNLLDNARKYSPADRPITLTLDVAVQALLAVRDEGSGVPEADLPHLFERFYRSSTVTRATVGLGLGLALSRELAHRLGGDITVTSTEGQGATFTLSLPLAEPPAA